MTLCLLAGSLSHLFTRPSGYEFSISFAMFPVLWESGLSLDSGGVLSGALADLFGWLFGRAGATVLLLVATIFLLLTALNKTIVGIVDAIKNRERHEYIPEPVPEPTERSEARQRLAMPFKNKKAIDIPIDEDEKTSAPEYFEKPKKDAFFKGASRVRTPDQLVSECASDDNSTSEQKLGEQDPAESIDVDTNKLVDETDEAQTNLPQDKVDEEHGEVDDLPLDIPFMEKKRRRKAAAETPMTKTPDIPILTPIETPPSESSEAPSDTVLNKKTEVFEPVITVSDATYVFPPLDLLAAQKQKPIDGDDEVRVNSERLESAFQSFGVNVRISNATRGPAVTRYEAALEAGVKLSKLTNLADDIALSLGTSGVRIAAMPNMISTVGIEVPNKKISMVYLRDILESQEFNRAQSKLTFAIGTDISGESIVGNISKMPHMLVAGTTGSGKSVCLNSIILSILYKATPDDVRFIMIDPKMVEFKVYNDIPHLLVPVVTDVKKASGALQWAVFEMMKRYTLFSETNARDLAGYNEFAREEEDREPLPQIVIVIDELADLMMTAAKEVEESVCRVAQMGRAAGMHLIIATQSPRADVITGLMKANIPSRIAFKVSSALESRIILDAGGNADKLVGHGDMLYAPTGTDKPMRVQGTWVSDKEREKVVDFIKTRGETQYSEEVMGEIEKAAIEKGSGEKPAKEESDGSDHDELLPQAVDVIFETGQASVSMLQRRLKLGYSRAARIVDQMEQLGVVGPFEGSKPRALLITKDQWRQMQYISGSAPEDKPIAEPLYPPVIPIMVNEDVE